MEHNPKKSSRPSKQEQRNKYVQFSGLATQIVVIVVAGVYAGKWLDVKMENEKPFATIFLTLFSIVASLYYLVKKVKQ
ncbi:MAG: AtpZ/AtpI family protein [Flavobacteriales bacterium]|nr:AtpZ/AtpI family protein [Flavobacteriales bacterium]